MLTIKKKLTELYFQLNIMMKLKDSRQLEFYENHSKYEKQIRKALV